MPRVSIVTAFYNRAGAVAESIGSLTAQTYPDREVIVVDDGSTDDTAERLRAFEGPGVTVIRQENAGFVAAINRAAAAAQGEFIAIHGAGDVSLPRRIEAQVALMDARPDIVVSGCRADNSESHNSALDRKEPTLDPDLFTQVVKNNPLVHGTIMYRADAFRRVGGYRSFFTYAQDHDILLRLSELGGYALVPEVLYIRKTHANSVNADPRKTLLQRQLAEFADQLGHDRRAGRGDMLDRYGPAAALLRRPSRALGERLANTGLRWRATWNDEAGRLYLDAARREPLSPRARLAVWLGSLPPGSFGWERVVKPALARAYGGVARLRAGSAGSGAPARGAADPT